MRVAAGLASFVRAGIVLLCSVGTFDCIAQQSRTELSVDAAVTATDNSGYALREQARSDLILSASPRLRLSRRAFGYSLNGEVGVDALTYLNHTQRGRVLPSSNLQLNTQLVDQWLFVDASNQIQQTRADTFGVMTNEVSTINKVTTTTNRVSPYIDHKFRNGFSLSSRADITWQRNSQDFVNASPQRNSRTVELSGGSRYMPSQFGVGLEFDRTAVDYSDNAIAALDTAEVRAVMSFAPNAATLFELFGGHESARIALVEQSGSIYGIRSNWRPTERHHIAANVEHRFFGNAWAFESSHRSPTIAAGISLSRFPSTQRTSFGLTRSGGDTGSLLDAMLTTRYPNPAERAVIVENIIDNFSLPRQLTGPFDIFADYAQLWRSASLYLALMGRNTVVTLNMYSQRAEELRVNGVSLGGLVSADADVRQYGGTLDLSFRLSPTLSSGVSLRHSTIDGLGSRLGSSSQDSMLRIRLSNLLSARTSIRVGVGVQRSRSNIGTEAVQELSCSAILSHRF